MKVYILLGAPGSGKGTIASQLVRELPWVHVSTGDMLREAVREGSPVGLQAKAYMERGELVPDGIILGIVRERMERDASGRDFLFDGFPRTLEQARGLDALLAELRSGIEGVFLLNVPDEVVVERLAGRRVCSSCGAVYHVKNIPPKQEGICDRCGGALVQRSDDREETVRNRLAVYRRQTESLIDHYRQRGLLVDVDASGMPAQTVARIRHWLGGRPAQGS